MSAEEEKELIEKLACKKLEEFVASIKHEDIVHNVLDAVGDTDIRGLRLVQFAMNAFEMYCFVSSETLPPVSFEKMDRGSNKSFSGLPEVVESRLGNVFAFNAGGSRENPDGVWKIKMQTHSCTEELRGLVVEIDGDNGKATQPRVTATKMWEHLMYSKLVAGSGRKGMSTVGYTMRINMARTEVEQDEEQKKKYKTFRKNPRGWAAEAGSAQFCVVQCIRALHALVGSVIFCLRDIAMCMLKVTDHKLYAKAGNRYHVNMFIGPFTLNIPDGVGRTSQATPVVPQTEKGQHSKSEYRHTEPWMTHLQWEIDFKLLNASTCGAVKVQYLLIENYSGHTSMPVETTKGSKVWKSVKDYNKTDKYYYNRGLMSLLDILYTPELFMMKTGPGQIKYPNWKRSDFVRTKSQNNRDVFPEFFEVVVNMCRLMENFVLYQIKGAIVWEIENTWPMREWMINVAHALNASTSRLLSTTRATMSMTPDRSEQSPSSLSARLRSSLRITLPVLDNTVDVYMRSEGFDHIRDAGLYLRLVGVTNYLALEQLARTHQSLLDSDEFHGRIFKSLPVGTQSEMRLMFQRIVGAPRAATNAMHVLNISAPIPPSEKAVCVVTYSLARDMMRNLIDRTIAAAHGPDGPSVTKWKSEYVNDKVVAVLDYLILHAVYFMSDGMYELARAWPLESDASLVVDAASDVKYADRDVWIRRMLEIFGYTTLVTVLTEQALSNNINGDTRGRHVQYLGYKISSSGEDVYTDNDSDDFKAVEKMEANVDKQKLKQWCVEFQLGYTRLSQFIYVMVQPPAMGTTEALNNRTDLERYMTSDHRAELYTISLEEKTLPQFPKRMMYTIMGHLFQYNTPGVSTTFTEIETIRKALQTISSNVKVDMVAWHIIAQSYANEVIQFNKLTPSSSKKIMDIPKIVDVLGGATASKTQKNKLTQLIKAVVPVDDAKKNFETARSKIHQLLLEYKKKDSYILFELYFSFRKNNLMYGDIHPVLPPLSDPVNNLYDDSDESSSSDEDTA